MHGGEELVVIQPAVVIVIELQGVRGEKSEQSREEQEVSNSRE